MLRRLPTLALLGLVSGAMLAAPARATLFADAQVREIDGFVMSENASYANVIPEPAAPVLAAAGPLDLGLLRGSRADAT